jgi:hypothetical protein
MRGSASLRFDCDRTPHTIGAYPEGGEGATTTYTYDADGLCAADDNCPRFFNPDQQRLVFAESILPTSPSEFAWSLSADIYPCESRA